MVSVLKVSVNLCVLPRLMGRENHIVDDRITLTSLLLTLRRLFGVHACESARNYISIRRNNWNLDSDKFRDSTADVVSVCFTYGSPAFACVILRNNFPLHRRLG